MVVNEKLLKSCSDFFCKNCDYSTSKKSSYDKHITTSKHKKSMIVNKKLLKSCSNFFCEKCNKTYKDNSGLWRHKKKCTNNSTVNYTYTDIDTNTDTVITTDNDADTKTKLIEYLIKENTEFKQLMIEQNKQMMELAKNTGNNNNNTNNSFNLNFFLNETCKNAMNIMDFVSELKLSIKDLEETGRIGFAEGISKIFINGLKQIDVSNRPVHCSDLKRETVYIKNNDQWNKEDNDKTILTNAIKHVAHKNIKLIPQWTKQYTNYNDSQSKQNDTYLQIVCQSMSGSTQEETNKNYEKIIKYIVKETIVEKS